MGSEASDEDFRRWRIEIRSLPDRLKGPIRRRADQSDLAQEALIQLWLQKISPDQINNAYLKKVAHGHACKLQQFHNRERRSVAREAIQTHEAANRTLPLEVIEKREQLARLARLIESMPEFQQAVIHARYFRGLSLKEIAVKTGHTERQCRYALQTAMATLRLQLVDDGDGTHERY